MPPVLILRLLPLTEGIVHNLDDVPPRLFLDVGELPHGDPVPQLLLDVQFHRYLLHLLPQRLNVVHLQPQTVVNLNIKGGKHDRYLRLFQKRHLLTDFRSNVHLLCGHGQTVGEVLQTGSDVLLHGLHVLNLLSTEQAIIVRS